MFRIEDIARRYAGYVFKDAGDINGDGFDGIIISVISVNDTSTNAYDAINARDSYSYSVPKITLKMDYRFRR